ncbi:MAG: polysaccharide deacetylase family protein, partial [Thermodesulfobacteriota bacterium]
CVIHQNHHFSADTPRSTSVTPEEFDNHLAYLDNNQYKVLQQEHVVNSLLSKKPLPDRCVAITIDDAYISVYKEAFPRLRKLNWPFTVFVNSEQVDQGSKYYMTWAQMREMSEFSVNFENHSHSHSHLIRRKNGENEDSWITRVENDISTAQERIAAELGQKAKFFAYPYGEYNNELKKVVNGLGLMAFGQQSGPAWAGSDFLFLPRFSMAAGYASMPGFKTKARTLPLPVIEATPKDPLLTDDEWRPVLTIRLAEGDYRKSQLQCFVSGQGTAELKWIDETNNILEVRAIKPVNVGRSRYNCTAPSLKDDRYFWYSHGWIRKEIDGTWYRE